MSVLTVREIPPAGLREFVMLPFSIYRKDPNWVAPLIADQLKSLRGGSKFISGSEHAFLMAYEGRRPCARILVGRYAGMKPELAGCCYFSLPEATNEGALKAILDAAEDWASSRGLGKLIGPWSPTDGEDDRCFLIDGFDGPPTLMGTYNQRWYPDAMDKLGYGKEMDLCTFLLTGKAEIEPRIARALELALLRSKAEISHVDIKHMDEDAKAMFEILKACSADDPLLPDPTWEQFMNEARQLAKLADERLILIARKKEDKKPVAFVVCMPNWSEVLKKMRGRLLPFGWVHVLGAKRKIEGMRALMQFCVPEYRGSGIMAVLYWKIFEEAVKAGYAYGEAGIIKDDNFSSRRPIEAIGGKQYRTYRWYSKKV
ncbi:MAG TPA: hypothetical protein PLI88_02530 [Bacillota bacterium]|mgnify:FL=1|nr:hypothetical protein [Bacillota bacterium]